MTKVFEFKVRETRVYDVNYQIEADNEEEARIKAEMGDTDNEWGEQLEGVYDRQIVEGKCTGGTDFGGGHY